MLGIKKRTRLTQWAAVLMAVSACIAGSALVAGAATLNYPEPHYGTSTGTVAIDGGPTFPISYFAQTVSTTPSSGVSASAKSVLEPIIVTKQLDDATPILFKAAANGARYPRVTVTVQSQSSQAPPISYTLEDVRVTDDQEVPLGSTNTYPGPTGTALPAVEVVTFLPARVTVTVGNTKAGYDFAASKQL